MIVFVIFLFFVLFKSQAMPFPPNCSSSSCSSNYYGLPNCDTPLEPTLPEKYRTWNIGNPSKVCDYKVCSWLLPFPSAYLLFLYCTSVRRLDKIPPLAISGPRAIVRPMWCCGVFKFFLYYLTILTCFRRSLFAWWR